MKVEDLMTREVVSVSPETTLKEVAGKLVQYKISGIPVCDDDGRVLGVVSEADILYRERGTDRAGRSACTPVRGGTRHGGEEGSRPDSRRVDVDAGDHDSGVPDRVNGGAHDARAGREAPARRRYQRRSDRDHHPS